VCFFVSFLSSVLIEVVLLNHKKLEWSQSNSFSRSDVPKKQIHVIICHICVNVLFSETRQGKEEEEKTRAQMVVDTRVCRQFIL